MISATPYSFAMIRFLLGTLLLNLGFVATTHAAALGNGIKVGEVTATSAIVWTRVTTTAEYNICLLYTSDAADE